MNQINLLTFYFDPVTVLQLKRLHRRINFSQALGQIALKFGMAIESRSNDRNTLRV